MMSGLCVLCLTAVLAVFSRLAETVGPVVRCEPCDAGALGQCKPLPKDCTETVREPGCGCCMTCALTEGQSCGVYTGRCGSGLTCQHQPENSRVSEEERSASNSTGSQGLEGSHRVPEAKGLPHHAKVDIIKKDQSKKSQSYKVESVSSGLSTDMQNFSLETKRETEYGPCRREMESILNSLKITNVLNPRGFRIPNCDKKGFYKKKQCRPSKGRKRGYCWCVDKYGQPLPGYDGKERGEAQCYNLESK